MRKSYADESERESTRHGPMIVLRTTREQCVLKQTKHVCVGRKRLWEKDRGCVWGDLEIRRVFLSNSAHACRITPLLSPTFGPCEFVSRSNTTRHIFRLLEARDGRAANVCFIIRQDIIW